MVQSRGCEDEKKSFLATKNDRLTLKQRCQILNLLIFNAQDN